MSEPAGGPDRKAMALRGEFVRAFVEYAGPKPASERLKVRLPTLITVTALTAVGALVVGVFWSLVKPQQATGTAGASASTAASTPAATTYTAVAGWDCVGNGDRGFEAQGRTAGWNTVAFGGWSQDGCHGTFETIPMTGKAATDDPQQYGQWWFEPGSAITHCQISTYVPAGDSTRDTGARAAHYSVLSGRNGTSYADFVVAQSTNRGRWVSAGSYPIGADGLAVKLTDRGVPAHTGDRIAMAQLKVTCSR